MQCDLLWQTVHVTNTPCRAPPEPHASGSFWFPWAPGHSNMLILLSQMLPKSLNGLISRWCVTYRGFWKTFFPNHISAQSSWKLALPFNTYFIWNFHAGIQAWCIYWVRSLEGWWTRRLAGVVWCPGSQAPWGHAHPPEHLKEGALGQALRLVQFLIWSLVPLCPPLQACLPLLSFPPQFKSVLCLSFQSGHLVNLYKSVFLNFLCIFLTSFPFL